MVRPLRVSKVRREVWVGYNKVRRGRVGRDWQNRLIEVGNDRTGQGKGVE